MNKFIGRIALDHSFSAPETEHNFKSKYSIVDLVTQLTNIIRNVHIDLYKSNPSIISSKQSIYINHLTDHFLIDNFYCAKRFFLNKSKFNKVLPKSCTGFTKRSHPLWELAILYSNEDLSCFCWRCSRCRCFFNSFLVNCVTYWASSLEVFLETVQSLLCPSWIKSSVV